MSIHDEKKSKYKSPKGGSRSVGLQIRKEVSAAGSSVNKEESA